MIHVTDGKQQQRVLQPMKAHDATRRFAV
jgi:hypothetical protein